MRGLLSITLALSVAACGGVAPASRTMAGAGDPATATRETPRRRPVAWRDTMTLDDGPAWELVPHPVPYPTPAVQDRLARLPAFDRAWWTGIADLSDDELAALFAYERVHVHPTEVTATCAAGRRARVGSADRTAAERVADLRAFGRRCYLPIGAVVACELAVRDQPCIDGGVGLPECVAVEACHERIRAAAEQDIWVAAHICIR